MQINGICPAFRVRRLTLSDARTVFALYQGNPQYFDAMHSFAAIEGVEEDLTALPPRKTYDDKFFLGFYDGQNLIGVMDLILRYPDEHTAYIGLFMVAREQQGRGIGTQIIMQVIKHIKLQGFDVCRLGYVKSNHQSKAFWEKNGFFPTGMESRHEHYTIVMMEKRI